jgi:hypothetical protein
MSIDQKSELFEFRFHYHTGDAVGFSDRYFLAHDLSEANEMFKYACSKRASLPMLCKVEKWNRWADRWEKIDFVPGDPILN